MADVAVVFGESLYDQELFDFFEAHVFQAAGGFAVGAEGENGGADLIALGEKNGAFDDMIELADVSLPGVFEEKAGGCGFRWC